MTKRLSGAEFVPMLNERLSCVELMALEVLEGTQLTISRCKLATFRLDQAVRIALDPGSSA